ncbi:unnamed protein product [Closterium sp. NIES-65]|nr:unnamed protein product [Closterium sp. NIES-65]
MRQEWGYCLPSTRPVALTDLYPSPCIITESNDYAYLGASFESSQSSQIEATDRVLEFGNLGSWKGNQAREGLGEGEREWISGRDMPPGSRDDGIGRGGRVAARCADSADDVAMAGGGSSCSKVGSLCWNDSHTTCSTSAVTRCCSGIATRLVFHLTSLLPLLSAIALIPPDSTSLPIFFPSLSPAHPPLLSACQHPHALALVAACALRGQPAALYVLHAFALRARTAAPSALAAPTAPTSSQKRDPAAAAATARVAQAVARQGIERAVLGEVVADGHVCRRLHCLAARLQAAAPAAGDAAAAEWGVPRVPADVECQLASVLCPLAACRMVQQAADAGSAGGNACGVAAGGVVGSDGEEGSDWDSESGEVWMGWTGGESDDDESEGGEEGGERAESALLKSSSQHPLPPPQHPHDHATPRSQREEPKIEGLAVGAGGAGAEGDDAVLRGFGRALSLVLAQYEAGVAQLARACIASLSASSPTAATDCSSPARSQAGTPAGPSDAVLLLAMRSRRLRAQLRRLVMLLGMDPRARETAGGERKGHPWEDGALRGRETAGGKMEDAWSVVYQCPQMVMPSSSDQSSSGMRDMPLTPPPPHTSHTHHMHCTPHTHHADRAVAASGGTRGINHLLPLFLHPVSRLVVRTAQQQHILLSAPDPTIRQLASRLSSLLSALLLPHSHPFLSLPTNGNKPSHIQTALASDWSIDFTLAGVARTREIVQHRLAIAELQVRQLLDSLEPQSSAEGEARMADVGDRVEVQRQLGPAPTHREIAGQALGREEEEQGRGHGGKEQGRGHGGKEQGSGHVGEEQGRGHGGKEQGRGHGGKEQGSGHVGEEQGREQICSGCGWSHDPSWHVPGDDVAADDWPWKGTHPPPLSNLLVSPNRTTPSHTAPNPTGLSPTLRQAWVECGAMLQLTDPRSGPAFPWTWMACNEDACSGDGSGGGAIHGASGISWHALLQHPRRHGGGAAESAQETGKEGVGQRENKGGIQGAKEGPKEGAKEERKEGSRKGAAGSGGRKQKGVEDESGKHSMKQSGRQTGKQGGRQTGKQGGRPGGQQSGEDLGGRQGGRRGAAGRGGVHVTNEERRLVGMAVTDMDGSFDDAVHAHLLLPIRASHALVSRAAVQVLFTMGRYRDHCTALHCLFLSPHSALPSALLHALHAMDWASLRSLPEQQHALSSALDTAISRACLSSLPSSSLSRLHTFISPSSLSSITSLPPHPMLPGLGGLRGQGGGVMGSARKQLTWSPLSAHRLGAFDFVRVGYDPGWPASVVIPPQLVQQYADVLTALIRLQHVQRAVENITLHVKVLRSALLNPSLAPAAEAAAAGTAVHRERYRRLCFLNVFTVRAAQLVSCMLAFMSAQLQRAAQHGDQILLLGTQAEHMPYLDLFSFQEAHAQFLLYCTTRCLLDARSAAIRERLDSLLQLVLDVHRSVDSARMVAPLSEFFLDDDAPIWEEVEEHVGEFNEALNDLLDFLSRKQEVSRPEKRLLKYLVFLKDLFRINRSILEHIVAGMQHYLEPIVQRSILTMYTAVLIPIKYLASGISYVDISYLFGISKTLCHEVVDVFLSHFPSVFKAAWVRFPTREELPEMAREFAAVKGVPAVVGAVDGTHIHMKGMEGHKTEYWTRKSAYAVQLQVTCDARGRIWDYLIGYPGSAHDMRVFKESALLERLQNGDIAPYQIVGDAAYPLREYCLTPLHAPRGEDLMDDWAQTFNYCQSATRMAVERCIGAFKGRWRIFGQRNDCRLWRLLAGAACCIILHNMCEDMQDVRRRNMAWANIPRNRDPWWTRGAVPAFKWEPCDPPTQQALRERRKRLGEALQSSYANRRRREPILPHPHPPA